MRFIFVCPENNKTFESDDFELTDNRGIAVDKDGKKFLDAKVALSLPCPFCGKKHIFHASELTCPFTGQSM